MPIDQLGQVERNIYKNIKHYCIIYFSSIEISACLYWNKIEEKKKENYELDIRSTHNLTEKYTI